MWYYRLHNRLLNNNFINDNQKVIIAHKFYYRTDVITIKKNIQTLLTSDYIIAILNNIKCFNYLLLNVDQSESNNKNYSWMSSSSPTKELVSPINFFKL